MDKHSILYEEVYSLTSLASVLFQRPPASIHDAGNDEEPPRPPEIYSNGEPSGLLDIPDFEDEFLADSSEAGLILVKKRALDRLAEILARYKTTKAGGGPSKPKGKQANLDAKNVTSVVMVEKSADQGIVFLCAKNEGLSTEDEEFLEKLGKLLSSVSKVPKDEQMRSDQSKALDLIFSHNISRVNYYSGVLRDAYHQASEVGESNTPTKSIMEQVISDRVEPREWEGITINMGMGSSAVSQKVADCLSNKERDEAVTQTFNRIQTHFVLADLNERPYDEIQDFMQGLYAIVRNPKERAGIKNLLKQELHGSEKLFSKAWTSLLFLARIVDAAVILVELASKLKSVSSFQFITIQAREFQTASYPGMPTKLPLKAVAELPFQVQNKAWIKCMKSKKTIKGFKDTLGIPRSIHAEVQLISWLESRYSKDADQVFPYIGCSRKCCFFCEAFRISHGKLSARGTHETLFPRWGLPSKIATDDNLEWLYPLMITLARLLRIMLRKVFTMPYPLPEQHLLQQSSAALSTAQARQREEPIYSERPSAVTNLVFPMGFSATERQVQFAPLPGKPGYASFLAPSMPHINPTLPIEQAEMHKINHDRARCSLEPIDKIRSLEVTKSRQCRHCHRPAGARCSACWSSYCSPECQKQDWGRHVFTCRTPNRPNDVDFLRLILTHTKRAFMSENPEIMQKSLVHLLSDDHICRTFGFSNCLDAGEVMCLVCLYDEVISSCRFSSRVLNQWSRAGLLNTALMMFCDQRIQQAGGEIECDCISWYLTRQERGPFPIPDLEGRPYRFWDTAIDKAMDCLGLHERFLAGWKLNPSQSEVFKLFVAIQPTLWREVDINSSTWVNFGFCYCTSFEQRQELSTSYLSLAASNVDFDEIVCAYETSTLPELMVKQGIDLSSLTNNEIRLERPFGMEYCVFRLMLGVGHALHGTFCRCFRVQQGRSCHSYYETHLDTECDVSYGFHLTNSWERWQLLNFYRYLFQLPGFSPIAMAAAKESRERGSLERYLDGLIPEMRMKIFDMDRASSIFFPNLDGRIEIRGRSVDEAAGSHLPCHCRVHDVIGPPGLYYPLRDDARWGVSLA